MIYTVPAEPMGGGLAKGTSMSLGIVKDSLLGSVGTIVGMLAPVLLVGVVVLALAVTLYVARRILAEAREGATTIDPRALYDPTASTVLGEWP